jgi:hypothetical protein
MWEQPIAMMPQFVALLSSEALPILKSSTDISQVPARYSLFDFYELMVTVFLPLVRVRKGEPGEGFELCITTESSRPASLWGCSHQKVPIWSWDLMLELMKPITVPFYIFIATASTKPSLKALMHPDSVLDCDCYVRLGDDYIPCSTLTLSAPPSCGSGGKPARLYSAVAADTWQHRL